MTTEHAPPIRPIFANPPVQQVVLGLFLKPLLTMRSKDIMPLLTEWSSEFENLSEGRPQAWWRPVGQGELSEAIQGGGDAFATPFFTLTTADGERSIQIQQDRFELVWRSSSDATPSRYAGFDNLKTELQTRFESMKSKLGYLSNLDFTVERTDATYKNLVDLPVKEYCVGLLSDWQVKSATGRIPTTYSAMRLGGFPSDDESTNSLVAIEPGPDGWMSKAPRLVAHCLTVEFRTFWPFVEPLRLLG